MVVVVVAASPLASMFLVLVIAIAFSIGVVRISAATSVSVIAALRGIFVMVVAMIVRRGVSAVATVAMPR